MLHDVFVAHPNLQRLARYLLCFQVGETSAPKDQFAIVADETQTIAVLPAQLPAEGFTGLGLEVNGDLIADQSLEEAGAGAIEIKFTHKTKLLEDPCRPLIAFIQNF
jgi:hypothetical protein